LVSLARDGHLRFISPVDAKEDFTGIGIFPDRELLVSSLHPGHMGSHWRIISSDGQKVREIAPEDTGEKDNDSYQKEADLSKVADMYGLMTEIFPWNGRLVSMHPGKNEISVWRPQGMVQRVKLEVPPGLFMVSMIPSDNSHWMVTLNKFTESVAEFGGKSGYVLNSIGEFDPETGKLLRIYIVTDSRVGMGQGCYADGVFSYLQQDNNDGTLEIRTASTQKE
jgi:hypothetical protein